jgi:hypothetical protein
VRTKQFYRGGTTLLRHIEQMFEVWRRKRYRHP